MGADRAYFGKPDEVRTFPLGKLELVNVAGGVIGRLTLQPGWHWTEHVKPIAGTDYCEAPHFQYHVSGTVHIKMATGEELDLGPGEVSYLPAKHDAWVVGDEPAVIVDWNGVTNYAAG